MVGAQTSVTAKDFTLTGDTLRGDAYCLSNSENKRVGEFDAEKATAILNEFNSWKASQN